MITVINIIAIVVSPVVAVLITLWVEKSRRSRRDKMALFKTLMTYRGLDQTLEWVNALNSIEVIFSGDSKVVAAWHDYLDALGQRNPDQRVFDEWMTKRIKLLEVMAKDLGYNDVKWDNIRKPYIPVWLTDEIKKNEVCKQGQFLVAQQAIANAQRAIPRVMVDVEDSK